MAEKMTARTDEILNSTKKTADAVKKIPPIDLSKILPT